MIKPQTLKGFRDYLPSAMSARERLIGIARDVYRSYGFSPINTPALEYSEVLLGAGGDESDKQVFRFQDQGDRDVALRFDLTVPFARFAAEHLSDIGMPFKRYQIGTVWRAEKPQKGRYREFIQADFDTIGADAVASDVETALVIHDLLERIGFQKFSIRVNNRLIFNGLLELLGLSAKTSGVLRALDKLHKIGRAAVIAEMTEQVGATPEQAERVLHTTGITGDTMQVLAQLQELLSGSETGLQGVNRLRTLCETAHHAGIPAERLGLDLSIARGLDYYTGTIYETFLGDLPGIGSVCSGGRYDNLAARFTKENLSGVGASLGLDRLLAAMEELGMVPQGTPPADVLVIAFQTDKIPQYLRIGRTLRAAGVAVEVFPDARPLAKQLKYANRKGFPLALIAGSDEFAAGTWQVKDLRTGTQTTVLERELPAHVKAALNSDISAESRHGSE